MIYLSEALQRLYLLIVIGTFGAIMAAALAAGSDPLQAIFRAVGSSIAMLFFYTVLCRLVLLVFDIKHETSEATPGSAANAK